MNKHYIPTNLILRVFTSATRATGKTLTQAGHVAPKFWVLVIRTQQGQVKTRYHKLLSNNKGDRRSGKSSDSKTVSLLSFVFASRCCNLKTCSDEANIMQHCWANNGRFYLPLLSTNVKYPKFGCHVTSLCQGLRGSGGEDPENQVAYQRILFHCKYSPSGIYIHTSPQYYGMSVYLNNHNTLHQQYDSLSRIHQHLLKSVTKNNILISLISLALQCIKNQVKCALGTPRRSFNSELELKIYILYPSNFKTEKLYTFQNNIHMELFNCCSFQLFPCLPKLSKVHNRKVNIRKFKN